MADVIKKAGYEAIWAAVRKLGSFTRDDLCVELGKEFGNRVNEHTVKSYLQRLTRAGHLSVKEESIGNGTARIHHYTLIKDTGVVAQAGPLLNDAGEMCGSLVILDVEDMDAAQAWAAGDPYKAADLFESVEIIAWKKVIG